MRTSAVMIILLSIIAIAGIIIVCIVTSTHLYFQSQEAILNEIISPPSFEKADLRFVVLRGDKLGYIDGQGKIVIEPQCDDAYPFHEGFATVMVKNKGWCFRIYAD